MRFDSVLILLLYLGRSYEAKINARRTTHDRVLNSAQVTVTGGLNLSQEQKDQVRQVFLANLGDLKEYEAAKRNGLIRKAAIIYTRQSIEQEFEDWKKRLRGQLDFTWKDLSDDVGDIRSRSIAGSSSVTGGFTGTGSHVQLLPSASSFRS